MARPIFIDQVAINCQRASFIVQNVTAGTVETGNSPVVAADATHGEVVVTLLPPPTPAPNTMYIVKKTDSSGNAVSVTPSSGYTIEGGLTPYQMTAAGDSLIILLNGTNWMIIAGKDLHFGSSLARSAQDLRVNQKSGDLVDTSCPATKPATKSATKIEKTPAAESEKKPTTKPEGKKIISHSLITNGNTISGKSGFLGGGEHNFAGGDQCVVAGGILNTAFGAGSSIPGGSQNTAIGENSFAAGSQATATEKGSFVWGDGSAPVVDSGPRSFVVRSTGGIEFITGEETGLRLSSNGTSWSGVCERKSRENVREVNDEEILEKLIGVPVYQFTPRGESSVTSFGPMAEDFAEAIPSGKDPRRIDSMDLAGVTLAALRGLHALVQRQATEIAELRALIS